MISTKYTIRTHINNVSLSGSKGKYWSNTMKAYANSSRKSIGNKLPWPKKQWAYQRCFSDSGLRLSQKLRILKKCL